MRSSADNLPLRSQTKKVLFLEHNVDGTVGGSHICLLSICRHLDRERYHPVVCFYQDNPLVEEFRQFGATVLLLPPFEPVIFGKSHIAAFNYIAGLSQSAINLLRMTVARTWMWIPLLKKYEIDIIHLNNSCAGDPDLVLAGKLLGIPVIAHQRGFPPVFDRPERAMARLMREVIAVSDAVGQNLVTRGFPRSRIRRIYDGIEVSRLIQRRPAQDLKSELGLPDEAPVIGMLGNVKWWKGQEVLVRAMPEIVRDFPDAIFIFVGKVLDETYKLSLDELIESADLTRQVIFTGYRHDATDLISIMDVVVHASVEPEPFGLVVLEAMGKGKAVVAADLGGPREIVTSGETGLLFQTGDSRHLANQITGLLRDETLREKLGHNGKEAVMKKFTAEINAWAIETVYEEILRSRRTSRHPSNQVN